MAFRVKTLQPDDPPNSFPNPAGTGVALGYPDGLLAIGGDLTPERLLAAYQMGIFPWYNDDQPILWWSPDPRAVIFPHHFHMSGSLARLLRRGGWEYSVNLEFPSVIENCAVDRGEHGTWITADMRAAYMRMHELGYAHSVESWFNGELAGGIYGIRLGGVFFGESMFSSTTGGSKVAISALISLCQDNAISMLDCQLPSEHLTTLGMEEIARDRFLELLSQFGTDPAPFPEWRAARRPANDLQILRKR